MKRVTSLFPAFGVVLAVLGASPALASDSPLREGTAPSNLLNKALGGQAVVAQSDAMAIALAMDIPASQVVSASLGNSDPKGAGVSDGPLGPLFPSRGSSFAILATGDVTAAETENNSGSTGSTLGGLNNAEGDDMVQLQLVLNAPAGSECLSFEFAFLSEEFPEWVDSSFNDAFTAELGQTDLTIILNQEGNRQVVAPFNFAFDSEGNTISVNTVFGVSAANSAGTTYDGSTPRIRAISPIDQTAGVTLYFTIQDLGDSAFDSAVFLDNFAWGTGPTCDTSGAFVDTDGDGLLDNWETDGIDIDGDQTIDIDLPAMGANPQHKDIFIEIDYMSRPGRNLQPSQTAIDRVVTAFANAPVSNPDGTTGITLHVDNGPASTMIPATVGAAAVPWGAMSRSNALPYQETLGSYSAATGYNWSEFDVIKTANFPLERRDVFHYNVWANKLGGLGTTSGISRDIPASDFLVSLGGWSTPGGTVLQQAGTFMHELGHNLALRHGGTDNSNYKPNYISVMNYAFQTRGLRNNNVDGNFDYSRFSLPSLVETNLNEGVGLNGGAAFSGYGTRWYCGAGGAERAVNNANGGIDWSCDGDSSDTGVTQDINKSGGTSTLTTHNDWAAISFTGGSIGALGSEVPLPIETFPDEIDKNEDDTIKTFFGVEIGTVPALFGVGVTQTSVTLTVKNIGDQATTFDIDVSDSQGNADLSGVPPNINLGPGGFQDVIVPVTVPQGMGAGTVETVTLTATDSLNPEIVDVAVAEAVAFDSQMVTSNLPTSRSVQVGSQATAFVSVINTGPSEALSVGVELVTAVPATFDYQTTDPATNALTGTLNTPVDIAPGALQTYVIVVTPTAAFEPRELEFGYPSGNGLPVVPQPGLNTLLMSASDTPVPDIVALAASTTPGEVVLPGPSESAAFTVATFNVGVGGTITATADTGDVTLPVALNICQTNSATGQCLASPGPSVTTMIGANESPTYGIFVTGQGTIANNPAVHRVNVRFTDGGGVVRGATSVAVRTQ